MRIPSPYTPPGIAPAFPLSLVGGAWNKYFAPKWEQLYAARFANLGNTCTIIGMGDSQDVDDLADTTFNTRVFNASGSSQVCTWNVAPGSMAQPYSLVPTTSRTLAGLHGPCGIPGLLFDGTLDWLSIPDADYWTTAASSACSIIAWILVANTATTRTILAKYTNAQEEFTLQVMGDETVRYTIFDTTAGVGVRRDSDAAISVGAVHQVAVTYDGGAGATAMNNAVVYVDGVSVASTATNNAAFVTMRNNTSTVTAGCVDSATPSSIFSGSIFGGPLGIAHIQTQLTAAQVLNDYRQGRAALGLA